MIHCTLREVTAMTERLMKETQFVRDMLEATLRSEKMDGDLGWEYREKRYHSGWTSILTTNWYTIKLYKLKNS